MRRLLITYVSLALLIPWPAIMAQQGGLQVAPPPIRVEPPSPTATVAELEERGDSLRLEKAYLDSIDYYKAALAKSRSAVLYNKLGIVELQLNRLKDARKDFGRAIKLNKEYAEAINNRGVTYYKERNYNRAIKEYKKAIALLDSASFHSNLGSAFFSKKMYDWAVIEYSRALQLDPDVFDRISTGGVAAHLQSPEDRARFSFMLARMYARMGDFARSLEYLDRAMEDGYKVKEEVYKDEEFTKLRGDPRFTELMSKHTFAISQ